MRPFVQFSVFATVGVTSFLAGRYFDGSADKNATNLFFSSKVLAKSASIDSSLSEINQHHNQPDNKATRISQIMKFGFPSLDNIRSYDNFVLSYDKRNRVANWVIEHLTADAVKYNEDVDRAKCSFFEDTSVHPYFRSQNSDYLRSGFDRGHLAAAGNHKAKQQYCEQTFVLSNMAPQVGKGFNRDAWNHLEKYTRKLTKKYTDVYVCTGPLYLPRVEDDGFTYVKYRVIGNNHVAVPTHFFKVLLMQTPDKSFELEAYVLPNQVIPDETPLTTFRVPLESIERASGLLIFDGLQKTNLKLINGKRHS